MIYRRTINAESLNTLTNMANIQEQGDITINDFSCITELLIQNS